MDCQDVEVQLGKMFRSDISSQTELRVQHVDHCEDHVTLHSEVESIINNLIDFDGQDCYEVVNVLDDLKQEAVYCNKEAGLIEVLRAIQSAVNYSFKVKCESVDDKLHLLQSIYYDTLKDIPRGMYLDDVRGNPNPQCLYLCTMNKSILDIIKIIKNSSIFKPFAGSFTKHVRVIQARKYTHKEYLIISLLHNISAFLKEIYQERKKQLWNTIPEEEIFYVEPSLELTKSEIESSNIVVNKIVGGNVVKSFSTV